MEDLPGAETAEPDCIDVSVVIPAYNEGGVIGRVIEGLRTRFDTLGKTHEVIVVDDGSTDSTTQAAADAGAVVVSHAYNMGNGAAVKTGLRRARGKVVVTMDGDGQHRAEDVERQLEHMREGNYDMAVGSRTTSSQAGSHRALANFGYNSLASYVVGHKVGDLTSGLRVIRRPVVKHFIELLPNTFSYPTTLTLALFRAGYAVAYLPIEAQQRVGKSKIRLVRDGLRFLIIIFKVCTLVSPLKIFMPSSAACVFAGLAYYLYTFFTAHRFTNMALLLILFGVQLFLLGLIAEQITQLYYVSHRANSRE